MTLTLRYLRFKPVISGWLQVQPSEYNPYRSFTLAKQNALQNLSLHIQTVVQGSQKALNENMQTISYQTSRNVFSNIHVMKRERNNGRIHLLVAVEEDNIFTWRD